jgi:hypothetical protein
MARLLGAVAVLLLAAFAGGAITYALLRAGHRAGRR